MKKKKLKKNFKILILSNIVIWTSTLVILPIVSCSSNKAIPNYPIGAESLIVSSATVEKVNLLNTEVIKFLGNDTSISREKYNGLVGKPLPASILFAISNIDILEFYNGDTKLPWEIVVENIYVDKIGFFPSTDGIVPIPPIEYRVELKNGFNAWNKENLTFVSNIDEPLGHTSKILSTSNPNPTILNTFNRKVYESLGFNIIQQRANYNSLIQRGLSSAIQSFAKDIVTFTSNTSSYNWETVFKEITVTKIGEFPLQSDQTIPAIEYTIKLKDGYVTDIPITFSSGPLGTSISEGSINVSQVSTQELTKLNSEIMKLIDGSFYEQRTKYQNLTKIILGPNVMNAAIDLVSFTNSFGSKLNWSSVVESIVVSEVGQYPSVSNGVIPSIKYKIILKGGFHVQDPNSLIINSGDLGIAPIARKSVTISPVIPSKIRQVNANIMEVLGPSTEIQRVEHQKFQQGTTSEYIKGSMFFYEPLTIRTNDSDLTTIPWSQAVKNVTPISVGNFPSSNNGGNEIPFIRFQIELTDEYEAANPSELIFETGTIGLTKGGPFDTKQVLVDYTLWDQLSIFFTEEVKKYISEAGRRPIERMQHYNWLVKNPVITSPRFIKILKDYMSLKTLSMGPDMLWDFPTKDFIIGVKVKRVLGNTPSIAAPFMVPKLEFEVLVQNPQNFTRYFNSQMMEIQKPLIFVTKDFILY